MDITALTLHQLRVFHAVARAETLTKAAENIGISQPAVSVQVKQLERILGIALLEAVGRRVQLTEPGRLVNEYAVRVLSSVDELNQAVMEIRGMERGLLVIGADTTVGIYLMPQLLGAWYRQHTQVEVDLRVGNHEELCELLQNNEVDMAVVSNIPRMTDLEIVPFLPNRLVVIAPPDHELARWTDGKIPARALDGQPFLVRESGSSTRTATEEFCHDARITPHIVMQLGSIGAIKQGVASGLGLGVVSERSIGNELAVKALVVLDIEGFPLEFDWFIVHDKDKRLSPAARSFKAYLHESVPVLAEPSLSRAPSASVPRRLRRDAHVEDVPSK